MPFTKHFFVSLCALGLSLGHAGRSFQHRAQDDRGNYAFSYNIQDPFGFSNGRWEIGDEFGNKRGGYTIAEPSGQSRYVEYVADGNGFHIVYQGSLPTRSLGLVERIASPDECTVHGAHHYGVCVPGRVLTQREIDYAPLIAMESYDAFESARLPRKYVQPEKLSVVATVPPSKFSPSYHHLKAVKSNDGPIVTKRKLRIEHGRKRRRHSKRTKFVAAYA